MNCTHNVAVIAYLFYKDKLLMLKRSTEPKIWAPPGGHLRKGEDPLAGLKREIFEETGLNAQILMPANTWHGKWNDETLISIDFIAVAHKTNITLSKEHNDYRWVTLEELQAGNPVPLDPKLGVPFPYFEFAFTLYNLIWNEKRDILFPHVK